LSTLATPAAAIGSNSAHARASGSRPKTIHPITNARLPSLIGASTCVEPKR